MSRLPIDRFEEHWKRSAQRPAELSPEEASAAVLARIEERPKSAAQQRLGWAWPALAAAASVVILAGVLFFRAPEPQGVVEEAVAEVKPLPLGEGVVLIWLDDETPLYMVMQPPSAEQRGHES